jgi:uncharacterized membrane protein
MTSVRDVEVPTSDPVARAATVAFGGPLGRCARVPGGALPWQPAAAVLTFVASVLVALGTLQKGYCTANGWGVPEVFWRGCYSDLPYLFSSTPLAEAGYPYPAGGAGLAQPPLTGALMWALAAIVPDGTPFERQRFYVLAWAVVLVLILAVLVTVTARSARRNPWRAAHVAASPLLVTTALVSPDLFGVMLASYGLYLWSRSRPELAGVLFGLAIAARTYPVLLVLVVGLLAVRAGRWLAWAAMAGTALLTYVGTLLVIYLAGLASGGAHGLGGLSGLMAPYRQWASAGPDYGSLWYLPRVMDVTVSPEVAVSLAVSGWVLALGLGGAVALSAPRRPTIAEVALIVVGVVLMTGRSLPVQASLWLIPLVALAGLRWRDHLVWASGELLYFVAIWLYLGGTSDPSRGLPLPWLAVFSVARLAGIGWLVVAAWRKAVRRVPAPDPDLEPPWGAPLSVEPGASPAPDVPPELGVPSESVTTRIPVPGEAKATAADDLVLDPSLEPDELAGPMAGRPDAVTMALR